MADIQGSLQRLQESIRGLSDASALVGALDVSGIDQGIFDEAGGISVSPLQQPAASPPYRHDEGVGSSRSTGMEPDRRSSLGSGGKGSTRELMLSSIPSEMRDSAEVCT